MNLYFNSDTLNFVNSPTDFSTVNNVSLIFGSSASMNVTLVNAASNGGYVLPEGYNMVLGLKPIGTYLTGNYLAYGSANLVPNTGLGDFSYNITGFNLYTTGISGLLAENSSITLAMELEYDLNGSGVVLSNPNTCTINNSYINLDQTPFITGALSAYPAPDNIQTISNLGVTYLGLNQTGIFQPSGNYVSAAQTGNFQPSGDYYLNSNPDNFIPSGNLIAGSGMQITQSGLDLIFVSSFSGGGGGSSFTIGTKASPYVSYASGILDFIYPINSQTGLVAFIGGTLFYPGIGLSGTNDESLANLLVDSMGNLFFGDVNNNVAFRGGDGGINYPNGKIFADSTGCVHYRGHGATDYGLIADASGNLYSNLSAGSFMVSAGMNSPIQAASDQSTTPTNTGMALGWLPITVGGVASWIPYYQ